MRFIVAQFASRHDIHPMFFGITEMMMPILRLFIAIKALFSFCFRQISSCYCHCNSISGLYSFRMKQTVFFMSYLLCEFSRITFSIQGSNFSVLFSFFVCLLVLFEFIGRLIFNSPFFVLFSLSLTLLIYYCANLTFILFSQSRVFAIVKFSEGFNFFAFVTSSCFNWFRHGFFLTKKLCLEPITAHTVVGSLYYTINGRICQ